VAILRALVDMANSAESISIRRRVAISRKYLAEWPIERDTRCWGTKVCLARVAAAGICFQSGGTDGWPKTYVIQS